MGRSKTRGLPIPAVESNCWKKDRDVPPALKAWINSPKKGEQYQHPIPGGDVPSDNGRKPSRLAYSHLPSESVLDEGKSDWTLSLTLERCSSFALGKKAPRTKRGPKHRAPDEGCALPCQLCPYPTGKDPTDNWERAGREAWPIPTDELRRWWNKFLQNRKATQTTPRGEAGLQLYPKARTRRRPLPGATAPDSN